MEKKENNHPEKFKTMIGGQALIEGIMMRGPEKQSIVVRGPEGIVVKTDADAKRFYDLLSGEHPVHLLSQDSTRFTNGVSITPIRMAKGLEFDEVIVPDADNRNYVSDYDRNLLYIACTRAMHKLTFFYTGSPSPFLPK